MFRCYAPVKLSVVVLANNSLVVQPAAEHNLPEEDRSHGFNAVGELLAAGGAAATTGGLAATMHSRSSAAAMRREINL
jgi:hypothetical protein